MPSTSDSVEALAMALREPPDLALVDYRMPRMDGAELYQELRHALGKRPPEGPRAADDRDPHLSAAAPSSAASASRRRASASDMSVRVTIGRTSPRSTSPSASLSRSRPS